MEPKLRIYLSGAYKILSRRFAPKTAPKRGWNRSAPYSTFLYTWDKIYSEPWYTTPQNPTKPHCNAQIWLYVNSWGRDKTQIIGSCRSKSLRHDFYVWQNRIFLKFEKFRIQKQTRFKTFVLLLQPSMKPLDQETSMEFRISWNQL